MGYQHVDKMIDSLYKKEKVMLLNYYIIFRMIDYCIYLSPGSLLQCPLPMSASPAMHPHPNDLAPVSYAIQLAIHAHPIVLHLKLPLPTGGPNLAKP